MAKPTRCKKCGIKTVRISWTALQRWDVCHRQDQLVRAGQRSPLADKRNFLTGNIVDHAMREWLDQDSPQPGDLVPRAEEMFQRWAIETDDVIKWKGDSVAADQKRVLNDAREALTILEPWLIENVLPFEYQPEAREWGQVMVPDVDGTLRQVELFFAVDILVRKGEKFHIYDLKTTRNENYVRGATLGQLPYYGLAISAGLGVPLANIEETAFLTPLCKQLRVGTRPDAEDYGFLVQRITRYAQEVWANNWDMRETRDYICKQCDVRHACPMGRDPIPDASGRVDFMAIAKQRGMKDA